MLAKSVQPKVFLLVNFSPSNSSVSTDSNKLGLNVKGLHRENGSRRNSRV